MAGKRVLDVACGDGYGSRILARDAERVFGLDNDPDEFNLAVRSGSLKRVEFHLGDARRLPFPEDYFDVAVSMETIEHFREQEEFLREIKRVVKPEGVVVISTPDHDTNMKMGVYHSRRVGHGHPGEMTFSQFFYLMNRYFRDVEFYGQMFLVGEPGLKHKLSNLVKRLDVLKVRRLIGERVRRKYNVSAHLVNDEYRVRKLDGQAAQLVAVGVNQK